MVKLNIIPFLAICLHKKSSIFKISRFIKQNAVYVKLIENKAVNC